MGVGVAMGVGVGMGVGVAMGVSGNVEGLPPNASRCNTLGTGANCRLLIICANALAYIHRSKERPALHN